VSNPIVLDFPEFGGLASNNILAASLLDAVVRALDAGWAVLYRGRSFVERPKGPFPDRGLYLSDRTRLWGLRHRAQTGLAEEVFVRRQGRLYLKRV
jgi:hypothetical protein